MTLLERNNRFILLDDQGRILIITREKQIALHLARTIKDGTSDSQLHR